MVTFILLLAAFVLFLLAAANVVYPRVNYVAAGLACWVLVALIGAFPK